MKNSRDMRVSYVHNADACRPGRVGGGFTLMEVVTSLAILAILCSSVLMVVKRCMSAAADTSVRMKALEVARENMETLLSSNSVKDGVEFGQSEKYPEITWETTVESFYEPVTNRMWVQAVCLAEYTDSNDVLQDVELTHWITNVNKQQLMQILEEEEKQKALLEAEGGIDTDGDGVPDTLPQDQGTAESGSDGSQQRSGIDESGTNRDGKSDTNRNNRNRDDSGRNNRRGRNRGASESSQYPWERPGNENMPLEEILQWLRDNGKL